MLWDGWWDLSYFYTAVIECVMCRRGKLGNTQAAFTYE